VPSVVSTINPANTCRSYDVHIGPHMLEMIRSQITGWRQIAIIADENTARLYANDVSRRIVDSHDLVELFVVPAGESSKSRKQKSLIEDKMFDLGFDRSAGIVGIGGGVVLDLAGYIAATYMRGIRHINVATSLLAQVDAALGGKTGINVAAGKNLIGAFHQPLAVLVPTEALLTLSNQDFRHGLAEVIKHAVIYDETLFESLKLWVAQSQIVAADFPQEILRRAVQIKADVVTADIHESGVRKILNFGHTAGHGIEGASCNQVAHGDAVAMGMMIEARIANRLGGFSKDEVDHLATLIESAHLPTVTTISFEAAWPYMLSDKKNMGSSVHCALPAAIGRYLDSRELGQLDKSDISWTTAVTRADFEAAWHASMT